MLDRDKKVAGLVGVEVGMLTIEQVLSPAQLEMFYENTPNGEALWDALQERRRADDTDQNYGWKEFAIEVIKNSAGKYLTPRSCQLPEMKEFMGAEAYRKMDMAGKQVTDTEILSAHREEQPALDNLRDYLCRGCNMTECPLYISR